MADIKNVNLDGTLYNYKDEKARNDISDLKEDFTNNFLPNNSIEEYLYKKDTYINNSGQLVHLSGVDLYKVPVSGNSLVCAKTIGDTKFWGGLGGAYVINAEKADGTFIPLTNVIGYVNDGSYDKSVFMITPSDAAYVYLGVDRNAAPNSRICLQVDDVFGKFNPNGALTSKDFATVINDSNAIKNYYYFVSGGFAMLADQLTYCHWFKVYKGDRITFDEKVATVSFNGMLFDWSGNSTVISINEINVMADGYAYVFVDATKPNNVRYYPVNSPNPSESIATTKDVNVLKEQINYENFDLYTAGHNFYWTTSLVKTNIGSQTVCKYKVEPHEVISVEWTGNDPSISISGAYVFTFEKSDGTIFRPDPTSNYWFTDLNNKYIIGFAPPESAYVYINLDTNVLSATKVYIGTPYEKIIGAPNIIENTARIIGRENAIYGGRCYITSSYSYIAAINDVSTYCTYWMNVKAGDEVKFIGGSLPGLSLYGAFKAADGTVTNFTSGMTFAEDGMITVFDSVANPGVFMYIPKERIMVLADDIPDLPDNEKLLTGKVFCSFGDSITYRNQWQPYVVNALGGTSVVCGIGSTPLSGSDVNAFWQTARLNTVKNANPDILTILGGANDLTMNPVIGDETDLVSKDTSNFIGAYSYIIDNLLTWKPSLKIIIISTTWAHNDGTDYSETVTYGDYAKACKLVAEYYQLPYVDMYNESGWNKYTLNSSPYNIYSDDHIHPNTAGAKILAAMVIQKIKQVFGVA